MNYLSICSGIEAASVAWHRLGWTPVGFSEIEPFPSAVLAHRFPDVPNFGDMTTFQEWPIEPGTIDVLVGGTPCQSFSVAGLRAGLSDPRGGLMLTYLEIARRFRPRWIVWENVPGVLSSAGGRDFGSFLGALGELGYGWAYRVLDAQWVRTHGHPRAVPQRRRRVFVVGCLGDWKRAAQVLFERESVQRDSAARRAKGQGVAADAEAGAGAGCYWDGSDIANTLTRKGCDDRMPDKDRLFAILQPVGYRWQNDRDGLVEDGTAPSCRASAGRSGFHEMNHPVVVSRDNAAVVNMQGSKSNACVSTDGSSFTLNAMHGHDVHAVAFTSNMSEPDCQTDGTTPTVRVGSGLGIPAPPAVAIAFKPGQSAEARTIGAQVGVACTLEAGGGGNNKQAVAVGVDLYNQTLTDGVHCPLRTAGGHGTPAVATPAVSHGMTVRRLTPRECERLQGFPDDWTLIPWRGKPADQCPDGPRYKALGNSMAVNCMAWIGERINLASNT